MQWTTFWPNVHQSELPQMGQGLLESTLGHKPLVCRMGVIAETLSFFCPHRPWATDFHMQKPGVSGPVSVDDPMVWQFPPPVPLRRRHIGKAFGNDEFNFFWLSGGCGHMSIQKKAGHSQRHDFVGICADPPHYQHRQVERRSWRSEFGLRKRYQNALLRPHPRPPGQVEPIVRHCFKIFSGCHMSKWYVIRLWL